MDQSPEITAPPQSNDGPTISEVSPQIVFSGPVTLSIARDEAGMAGHTIVTFAKPGPLTCSDLLRFQTTSELLAQAEIKGVSLAEPALLAVSNDQGEARTVYMTPAPQNNFRDFSVWVGQVTETIANLKAKSVGLYLCKESLQKEPLLELVGLIVRALVESKTVNEISLVVGHHSYNEILAMALDLKQEFDTQQLAVHVIH